MKWLFMVSSHPNYFFASDLPVSRIDPTMPNSIYAYGLANKKIEITFPLGPNLCMFGRWNGPCGAVHVPAKIVKQANIRTAAFAEKYVFAHRRDVATAVLAMRKIPAGS
jgi:Protein of unknown function (DUF4238)